MLPSCIPRWKDIGGTPVGDTGKGGVKCAGETERVVQDGSEDVKGGPLRMEDASDRDWERSRSWAERKAGLEMGGDTGGVLGFVDELEGSGA